jgi:DNA polymerase-3 subunit beta
MKIIFDKNILMNATNTVLKAVPSKTTMDILECILITAEADEVTLTANNTELGIKTQISANVIIPGEIAIDAKLFSEIIRKFPDSEVSLEIVDNTAHISCENIRFKIPCYVADEFTDLPEVSKEQFVHMSQYTLKEIIRQTIFSLSLTDSNPLITGELFEVNDNEFKVIALDGHRISIRRVNLNESYPSQKVIVPGKTLNEISKILTGEKDREVSLYFTKNHICFEFDQTIVVSRLIEGEYFKVDQMLSADYETSITVNNKRLLSSIERSTLLVKESDKKPIIFGVENNKLQLLMNSSLGSMKDELDVKQFGKDITIGFNPKFLIEALKVIDDEDVCIHTINAKAPCFIKDKEESYTYVILPVNFIQ